MKFTFGIITNGSNDRLLPLIHKSIMGQNIDDSFEILIVGGRDLGLPHSLYIPFDENIKPAWITKKKNIIARKAQYPNLCIMHDYFALDKDWYSNFQIFGDDWDVCMNALIMVSGRRFRDWTTWAKRCKEGKVTPLPYTDHSRTHEMYVSGGYFCVKKTFLLENPFNEGLTWGKGEDVEWSDRICKKWNYKCNPHSKVHLLKPKGNEVPYGTPEQGCEI